MSEQAQVAAPAVESVEVTEAPAKTVDTNEGKPTRDQVINERGWSAEEADKAEKRGMLRKEEEKKTPAPAKEAETKAEEKKPEPVKKLADHEFEMTAEQEEAFHKIFPAGTKPSAFFTAAKIERLKRQQAAREAEHLRGELATWKAKAEALEKVGGKKPEVDANGDQIDPDEQPLTPKRLRELAAEAEAERERQRKELENRSRTAAQAHAEQEAMAEQMFPDFRDAIKSAGELAEKLDEIITDPVENKFARKLMTEFQYAVANADKLGPDDLNAAELAYKLGRLNPNFGKKATADIEPKTGLKPESDPKQKGDGGLTPEQLKRLEQNTQRRASSASIPGGGSKKAVAPEEVTIDQLNRMPADQRLRFRTKYPEHYKTLLRG